ncbi:hypothetical protein TWF281_003555 [Arthrobotrys megalospora]
MAEPTGKDHNCVLCNLTDSSQLRNPEKKLHVNFTATVSIKIPHTAWAASDKRLWRSLTVESPRSVLLDIKLLWKQGTFPEEWSHVSESLGHVLSISPLWQHLGLSTSLEIPSHSRIYITLNSLHHTTLPSTLHLPTSSVRSIQWTFDFSPYYTRPKSAGLQVDHILPLFDECVELFLNNKVGALSLTGGLFMPGASQQIRGSMASMEAITSTLARYASQCDDYTLFKSRIKRIANKIESVSPIAEQAIDLQNALRCQVYHQILKALQGTRLRRKTHFRSSSRAENELLSQPLEKFQDLFDGTRNMLSQDDNDDEAIRDNEDERSDFEDLFEEEDNYSDFEDLLEDTRAIRQEIGDDMTPDSPYPVQNSSSEQDHSSAIHNDYDMASECSDFGFTMLEDSYITAPSQQYGTQLTSHDEEYDYFTDIESPRTPVPSSSPIEKIPPTPTMKLRNAQPFWENEESLMMLF